MLYFNTVQLRGKDIPQANQTLDEWKEEEGREGTASVAIRNHYRSFNTPFLGHQWLTLKSFNRGFPALICIPTTQVHRKQNSYVCMFVCMYVCMYVCRVLPTLVGTGRHLPPPSHFIHLFSIEKWCKHAKVAKVEKILLFYHAEPWYVCMYVCMYICMYVCMCICIPGAQETQHYPWEYVYQGCQGGILHN